MSMFRDSPGSGLLPSLFLPRSTSVLVSRHLDLRSGSWSAPPVSPLIVVGDYAMMPLHAAATGRYALAQVAPAGTAMSLFGLVAWKPQVVLAPAPRVAFCPAMPRTVTVWPVTVTLAFHDPVMVCPAGRVKVTVQPLS